MLNPCSLVRLPSQSAALATRRPRSISHLAPSRLPTRLHPAETSRRKDPHRRPGICTSRPAPRSRRDRSTMAQRYAHRRVRQRLSRTRRFQIPPIQSALLRSNGQSCPRAAESKDRTATDHQKLKGRHGPPLQSNPPTHQAAILAAGILRPLVSR